MGKRFEVGALAYDATQAGKVWTLGKESFAWLEHAGSWTP